MDPLQHFLLHGATELRNPNRHFDSRFYAEANPDVHDTGVNGFWHFLVQGRAQGRAPRRSREAERQAFLRARPPAERSSGQPPAVIACLTPAALRGALQARLPGTPGMTLAVSHDRYTHHVGGVQILVADEQAAFNARGEAYLHIAPVAPRLTLAPEGSGPFYIHATLDGAYVGVTTYADLGRTLAKLRPALPAVRRLVLHCLLGHQVHALVALHEALAPRDAVFWVNDYESHLHRLQPAAERRGLLRRTAAGQRGVPGLRVWRGARGAPGPHPGAVRGGAAACRRALRRRAGSVAARRAPAAPVSPGPRVRRGGGRRRPQPPCRTPRRAARRRTRSASPSSATPPRTRAGTPSRSLRRSIGGMAACKLFHFTAAPADPPLPGVEVVLTRVTPAARGAMTDALVAHGIDLVLVLSPWPETFCLVAYEAMAAGADIIALPGSGNIADMVLRTGRGVVVQDLLALTWFFQGGDAVRYVRFCGGSGSEMGRLASLGMTATLTLPVPA